MAQDTITDRLAEAYSPANFRALGHQLIDLVADHLEKTQDPENQQLINYREPEEELKFWQNDLAKAGKEGASLTFFEDILEHSIHLHHPHYIGHQV